tara:strand:+ start:555 stop:788 length:234 start_codon:yes stop_codon:yes gene_type:complete
MMNEYIRVKDNNTLLRDQKSNAIVNDSKHEYENYMLLKKQKQKEKNRVDNLESEVNVIKNDLSEIKNLLKSFIDKLQ